MTTWREALTSTWAEAQMRVQTQSRAMPNVFNVGILSNAEFGREWFAVRDQAHNTYPEWGDGFEGFAKRLGSRQAEFIVQNSVTSLGDGLLGWEPRYDRCRCSGFWPRTRHAIIRNFVTYDRTEKSLRPQLFPYLGAFTGSVTATAWQPGNPNWEVKGYQAVITQVPVGMGINWIGEFAPEITRVLHRHKK